MEADLNNLFKEMHKQNKKNNEKIRILQLALEEAARILSVSPPGDISSYTESMFTALCEASPNNSIPWLNYLISVGVKKREEEDLK